MRFLNPQDIGWANADHRLTWRAQAHPWEQRHTIASGLSPLPAASDGHARWIFGSVPGCIGLCKTLDGTGISSQCVEMIALAGVELSILWWGLYI